MYKDSIGTASCENKKATELEMFYTQLEQEASKFFNNVGEVQRKLSQIFEYNEPQETCGNQCEQSEPADAVGKLWHELKSIAKSNDRLAFVVRHLNQII